MMFETRRKKNCVNSFVASELKWLTDHIKRRLSAKNTANAILQYYCTAFSLCDLLLHLFFPKQPPLPDKLPPTPKV